VSLCVLVNSFAFTDFRIIKRIIITISFPIFIPWFISILAETNRAPFDLPEGEAELVSGFNVEFGAGLFALIFIAEYSNVLIFRVVTCVFFFSRNGFIVISLLIALVTL